MARGSGCIRSSSDGFGCLLTACGENTAGGKVTELYLVGSDDRGESFAGEGPEGDASVVITRSAAGEEAAMTFVLEFGPGSEVRNRSLRDGSHLPEARGRRLRRPHRFCQA